jgi:signal transduction histidine kinase/ActR/RegA family two-component response regulator
MNRTSSKIQEIRDQQLGRGMRAAVVMGFFALLGSLARIPILGWHNTMYIHIALYLVVVAVVCLEKHLPYSLKTAIILASLFLLGLAGLYFWGMGAFSLPAFFCFCVMMTVFYGTRKGVYACIASMSAIALIGMTVYAGIHSYKFNAAVHMNSPITWALGVLALALFAGVLVIVIGTLNRQVENLAEALERRNTELIENNLLLRTEISERIRAEEERKKLEEKLRDAEKMEAVGALAGGVAHDLNNILGGIVGYPDLILETLPAISPLRDPLMTIRKSGIKAAAIVSDMLTLARRRVELTEVINLNDVVEEYRLSPEHSTLMQFHPTVEIEVHTALDLKNIQGSPFHLSKVIMNLVSNAAEAMPHGGKIVIVTENRRMPPTKSSPGDIQEGLYSVLSVSDTGIGIAQEDLKRIFEPFYSKKKMGRSGTGLGMAVVWGTIKDHNGHIEVESVERQGTRFTLFFPITQEKIGQPKLFPSVAGLRGRGESIVVVDDVEEQREIASRILKDLGYSVRAFRSGEEAVEYLRTETADLLILDMIMDPGMNGLDTFKEALAIHPGQKAIITTGFSETAQLREALQLGVGCSIKKPYLLSDIGLAIKTELGKQAPSLRPNLYEPQAPSIN